ncbi:MAG: EAL domain-containing protein [Oscillospiraceae bacterium]|nr:EAL domain-containing protein [Oscillospiraceae bacterium]
MNREIETTERKRTVLVVEDNEMNREILTELLLDDYEVLEAENGQVGLDQLYARYEDISLVMLDCYMPVCDGFEFLERKREDSRFDTIPVIMMTASSEVDDEIRCLELGASDFVTKPYNAEVLKNRMMSVIRLRESSAVLGYLESDLLTGLYSKEYFYIKLQQLLQASGASYDILCSDVENFRGMNERWGTARCDEFLRDLADRMRKNIPGIVLGGRIGADVFAFLTEHREGGWNEVPAGLAGEDGSRFVVKFGVYEEVDHALPAAALCDRATLALGSIKRKFHQDISHYDEAMQKKQLLEQQIEESMEQSLRNGEFKVFYQPKHDLHSDHTGGAEALVRWIHPELGFMNPGVFIPLFERNGFITQVDLFIWEEVCKELRRCLDNGIPVVPVSVNASRMDFELPDLAERIADMADRYGLDRKLLHIEVTESMYIDNPKQIAETLEKLHTYGFQVELDDFGSGYSSLTSLNTLRLDVMKLDMSMIRHAAATNDYSLLRFAALLADGMRLKTVVEGVETMEQVTALRVLGCDYVQGYFYSKPLPAKDFEQYLAEHVA